MTVRVEPSTLRPDSDPSRMYSDSGVVTRICGGLRRMLARALCGVSPVRTKVRMGMSGKPSARSSAAMPASGASRLRLMSFESAFSGET